MSQASWAKAKVPRLQLHLVAPTLDDMIPQDDEIRLLDALLDELDWSLWERKYARGAGQPPIHPRLVAGTIIFALTRRLHSSRQIEEATRRRIDLIWFLQGRTLDHSTLCKFREKFADLLPGLFEELARKAAARGGGDAGRQLAVDGTRIRANSDRHGSRTASRFKKHLAELAEKRTALLEQMACLDALGNLEAADESSCENLERELKTLDARRGKMQEALGQAQQRDAHKRSTNSGKTTETRVPLGDPDAWLLPNKEGGYAPNYSPTLAVDLSSGAILDSQVPHGADEAGTLSQTIRASEQCLGRKVETLLCDGSFTSAASLKNLEEQKVAMCAPAREPHVLAAERQDLTQPIEPEHLDQLPTTGRGANKRFSRQGFVYQESEDCYYCPQGRVLRRVSHDKRCDKNGNERLRWRYQRNDCSQCPLAGRCLKGNARRRCIVRDAYQKYSDHLAMSMSHNSQQKLYKKRAPVVEGVFGYIKHAMGFRQFLRRGIATVRNEWQWICTAFNVSKILRHRLAQKPIKPNNDGPANHQQGLSGLLSTLFALILDSLRVAGQTILQFSRHGSHSSINNPSLVQL